MGKFGRGCRNSNIPKLVITGDVNMPKTNWESFISENQYETEVLQVQEKLHVSQEIRIPTFAQATLDVLLCNDDFVVRANYDAILNAKYSIDGRAASDHHAIQVEIHYEHHAVHRPSIMQYSFCNADYDELDRSIATDPFKGISWSNPNVILSQWQNWLDEKLKATAPARTKHRKSLPPWVSQEGSRLLKRVQSLQRTGNRDKTEAIEACDRQLKTDQQQNETLLAVSRDGNKLFKYYRTIKKPPVVLLSMFWNGTIATTDREIANLFNMFFQSVFSQKEKNQERQNEASTGPTLVNYDVSENKVLSIISYLDENKSCGHDKLPASLFKKTPALSKSISHLFKAIKDRCKFPDAWKTGKIKPIYKKVTNHSVITTDQSPSYVYSRRSWRNAYSILCSPTWQIWSTSPNTVSKRENQLSLSYLCTSA